MTRKPESTHQRDSVEDLQAQHWHARSADAVLADLTTDYDGLSEAEAARRLQIVGRNRLETTAAEHWLVTLGRQFVSPMVGILLVACVIMAFLQQWADAVAIAVILLLNAGIGLWQERKAIQDVQALAKLSAPNSRVVRTGTTMVISAEELVPGDIIVLESGDKVPADARLLQANNMRIDESMLTGESASVTKDVDSVPEDAPLGDRIDMAFSGTLVRSGVAQAVVVATGTATELGEISELVKGPTGKTPLQELTNTLEKQIGVVILVGSVILFVSGMLLGNDLIEMFMTVVALAVATLPEALPIVLTVAMSVGVTRMAKRNALVRSLPAVETLGSTTVIGSDKTGTLTMNELTVQTVWSADGFHQADGLPSAEDMPSSLYRGLRAGALTNDAELQHAAADQGSGSEFDDFVGDAVDVAMARVALQTGVVDMDEFTTYPLVHAPYESVAKYSQSIYELGGQRVLYVKGAPDTLAAASTSLAVGDGTQPFDADTVRAANEDLAARGLRVLATAYSMTASRFPILCQSHPI